MPLNYSYLIVISSCFILSMCRCMTYRYPHPRDIIILSIIFYNVPLALSSLYFQDINLPIFLSLAATEKFNALKTIELSLIAIISVYMGCLVGRKIIFLKSARDLYL